MTPTLVRIVYALVSLALCCGTASARCWGYNGKCNDEESAAMCQQAQTSINAFHEQLTGAVVLQNATALAKLAALRPNLDCASSISCIGGWCSSGDYQYGCQSGMAYDKCTGAGSRLLAYVGAAPGAIGAPVPPYLVSLASELATSGWTCSRNTLACTYYGGAVSGAESSRPPSAVFCIGLAVVVACFVMLMA